MHRDVSPQNILLDVEGRGDDRRFRTSAPSACPLRRDDPRARRGEGQVQLPLARDRDGRGGGAPGRHLRRRHHALGDARGPQALPGRDRLPDRQAGAGGRDPLDPLDQPRRPRGARQDPSQVALARQERPLPERAADERGAHGVPAPSPAQGDRVRPRQARHGRRGRPRLREADQPRRGHGDRPAHPGGDAALHLARRREQLPQRRVVGDPRQPRRGLQAPRRQRVRQPQRVGRDDARRHLRPRPLLGRHVGPAGSAPLQRPRQPRR